MADIGSAGLLIVPHFKGLSASVNAALANANISSGTSKIGNSVAKGIETGVGNFGKTGAIMGVFSTIAARAMSAVSQSVGSAVSRLDTLKNYPVVMQSLGVGAEEAQSSIDTMSERLKNLPTRLDDMAATTQGLYAATKNYGVSLGKATDAGLALNDMLLAGGQGTAVVNAAMEQFRQMLSKGKPDMQDWKSILMAAPGQIDQLAKSMLGGAASANDLYYALGGGKESDAHLDGIKFASISMSELLDGLIALDQQGTGALSSFSEQAQEATGGIGTAFANMQNALTRGVTSVLDGVGRENIVGAINDIKGGISSVFGNVAREAQNMREPLKNVWQTVKTSAGAFGEFMGTLKPFVPVIVAVVGGIKLTNGALGLLNLSMGKASGVAQTVADGLLNIAAATNSNKILAMSSAFSKFAGVLSGGWGIAITVAAVAIGALIGKYLEAKKQQDDFNNAISNMRGASERAATSLGSGVRAVKDYKESVANAALSVSDLTSKITDYNTKQKETITPYEQEIDMLGQYKTVIDEMATKTELNAGEQAKLDWALKGVNETLGTSFTAHDVLTGKYQTEQGEIKNTIDDLDKLIEKRQEEARIKATQELYTNAIKNQMELDKNISNAEREYNSKKADRDKENAVFDSYKKRESGWDNHSQEYFKAARNAADAQFALNDAEKALNAAREAAKGAADDTKYYADMLGVSTAAASEHGQVLQTQLTSAFANIETKAKDANFSIADIAGACEQSGVSIQTLTDLGEQEFYDLLIQSGGNIQTLIEKLKELDGTKLHEKHLDVNSNLADVEGFLNRINRMELAKKNLTISVSSAGDPVLGVGRVRAPQMRAKGGIIRKHADGAVFTSPTMIGARDMIGEAGAEYYDGTNIVPLTSRYSRPFARVIAEEFSSLVGSGASTTNVTNNTYIDGARVNDNAGVQALFMRFMTELVRLGEMNRGVPNGAY